MLRRAGFRLAPGTGVRGTGCTTAWITYRAGTTSKKDNVHLPRLELGTYSLRNCRSTAELQMLHATRSKVTPHTITVDDFDLARVRPVEIALDPLSPPGTRLADSPC